MGARFATSPSREGGWKPFLFYILCPPPPLICAVHYLCFPSIHGDCLTTVQPSSPIKPSPSRFLLGGFRSPSSAERRWRQRASRDAWRPYDSAWWAIFAVSQVFPEKPVNIGTIGKVSPSKSQFAETMCNCETMPKQFSPFRAKIENYYS